MAVDEWLDSQVDRCFDRQRAQADTAKLVATFLTGVSGGLIGTALQIAGRQLSNWERYGLYALGVAALLSLVVILLDDIKEADHQLVMVMAGIASWGPTQILDALRFETLKAVKYNEQSVNTVKLALQWQMVIAVGSSVLAAVALLR